MTCLPRAATLLISVGLVLSSACTDDSEADAGETGEETSGEPDEPLFFPPGTRLIPAGDVWRGCVEGDSDCDSDEEPGGWVHVSAFYIDQFEATVRSYEDCVDDDVCVPPTANPDCNWGQGTLRDHPMNCMSYHMASTYCAWRGLRLPTEAEWERAARGDTLQLYPWGDDGPTCGLAVVDECGAGTLEVGSLRAGDSPYDIADMVGNVTEWVYDYYDSGYYADSVDAEDPRGPSDGSQRGLKGSAFTVPGNFTAHRISKRNAASPDDQLRIYGARCARDR